MASVALGLSVDDTFHCLLQFHRDAKTVRFRRRLFDSYRVSGPGVLLSSLAVAVGFAALRASEFEPFVNFGTMVGIATAGSTLGNLVLLPACLTLGHRWLEKRSAATAQAWLRAAKEQVAESRADDFIFAGDRRVAVAERACLVLRTPANSEARSALARPH